MTVKTGPSRVQQVEDDEDEGGDDGRQMENMAIGNGRGNESGVARDAELAIHECDGKKMANSWITTGFAILLWVIIVAMNIANLVLLGRGD
jgi:Mn2+/Fe2+ NRAMP family transporter